MANVLITGMTASQASSRANARTQSYAGHMARIIFAGGHTLTWQAPEWDWDDSFLNQFDVILIGIAPVLSIGANHSLAALKLIGHLQYDHRLFYFIDAPVPSQITASLRAHEAKDALSKSFFKNRPNFEKAFHGKPGVDQIAKGVSTLLHAPWAQTFYPKLPWAEDRPTWLEAMPGGLDGNLIALNLDGTDPHLSTGVGDIEYDIWVTDSVQSTWLKKTLTHMTFGVAPMKETKFSKDKDVITRMRSAVGSIIPPHKDHHTWWTPRFIQSLAVGTPVATEWRESRVLGPEWAQLPGAIEDMSKDDRLNLAMKQYLSYTDSIPNMQEGQDQLLRALKL